MRKAMLRLTLACLAALSLPLSACSSDDATDPPFRLELPVDRSVLDNGLELIIVPNHTAPLVSALVAFRAGSSVEDAALNGYSHLFEHMIFQGSSAVPDSQAFRNRLLELGAAANATTGVDSVTYFFTSPSDSLDEALALFSGALHEPALEEARLDKERNVVLAEVDLNESSPDFAAYRAGLDTLFGDDAIRLDPLGSRDVVMSVSREDLLKMHEMYYVPNNAVLVLSGDVTHEQGRELARRHFGDWERAPDPFLDTPVLSPRALASSQYQVLEAETTNTNIELWWQGPEAAKDPEGVVAGDILGQVTLESDHSFRSLVSLDLALSARLQVMGARHAGYVRAALEVPHGRERAVLTTLRRVLQSLAEPGDVSSLQLETAQSDMFASFLSRVTTPEQLPHAVGFQFGVRDAMDTFRVPDRVYGVGQKALTRFARRYLRDRPKVMVLTSSADNLARQGIDEAWLRNEDAR